ncbi:dTMP kinase [filamentous cyanobacterium LEGE 11480]|uniref:Thymidylate kinase n=2 Tax=Romeriopsis TaxID=2992131 RepID=A0A928VN85_9CYAN|nr:dTMP kinase [Romeriopsis navalis LEGE 11480]
MQYSSHSYPGKLIVFEGGEGCGKTTQLQLTQTWLRENDRLHQFHYDRLLVTREPGGTDLCGQIRQVLLENHDEPMDPRTELLLYAADRTQHVEQCLKPALQRGDLVLCDRYTDSTVAYQGYGRGLDHGLIDQLNQIATDGLQPDLTIWLDLDVEVGLARAQNRGKRDRIEQSDLAFHQAVRQGFQALAESAPERFQRIDASEAIATVQQQIQTAIVTTLNQWQTPA